ncbi:class I SAM-dependent methyltransferase [Bordetella flabilis]|nr:rRNA adenine N-6-methyltransferase family protein [Bordetella flabilis]
MPIFRSMPSLSAHACMPFIAEQAQFIRSWYRAPRTVGAVLPSGSALAEAIVRDVDVRHVPVLELGSGTGAFTRRLVAHGIALNQLHLVELDSGFARRLRQAFPGARVHECDARRLTLPEGVRGHIGATVSGLPLLNMSARAKMALLHGVFAQMRPGAALYAFSYGWGCPVSQRLLDRLGLRAECVATVLRNVPPARVWKITRRAPCPRLLADVAWGVE